MEAMNTEKVLCVPTQDVIESVGKFNVPHDFAVGVLAHLEDIASHVQRDSGDGTGCEFDESLQQLIPYIVVWDGGNNVLCYQRKGGGEKRLDAKLSVGFGGHVNDGDKTFLDGVNRELAEEVYSSWKDKSISFNPQVLVRGPIGFIRETESAVGRVHTGLLYTAQPAGFTDTFPLEAEVWSWVDARILTGHTRLERWSQIALEMLGF